MSGCDRCRHPVNELAIQTNGLSPRIATSECTLKRALIFRRHELAAVNSQIHIQRILGSLLLPGQVVRRRVQAVRTTTLRI
mgnify:CR=1 FL=1